MKTCMIVSPYFPPAALAGVHRARHLVKHLPRHGWHPRLVCVHERFQEQLLDPDLATLVPSNSDIEKVSAVPIALTRHLGVGDISLRAFAQLRSTVLRAVSKQLVQAVLITGSPYYPMLLAPAIRKRGVAVVLDFQDPWVSKWGAEQSRASKAGVSHWLATQLEPRVVRAADFITSVSENQNTDMLGRYPDLAADRMSAIPIGGDPEDFSALRAHNRAVTDGLLAVGKINLSFIGTYMPRSAPLMHAFLSGVRRFRLRRPDLAQLVRFNFIGTGNHSNATESSVMKIAHILGVDDLVFELPQRIAFTLALNALVHSDAVMLIGSDEAHYTASKIYPGLMSKRPFLSLFHQASSSHAILSGAGGGIALGFDPAGDPAVLSDKISAALITLVSDPASLGAVDPASYGQYTADAIAGQFARVLDLVVQK
jgi:hypothetical protein